MACKGFLRAVEVDAGGCGGMTKLVHLRNPWRKFELNGAWSDNSMKWNDKLR